MSRSICLFGSCTTGRKSRSWRKASICFFAGSWYLANRLEMCCMLVFHAQQVVQIAICDFLYLRSFHFSHPPTQLLFAQGISHQISTQLQIDKNLPFLRLSGASKKWIYIRARGCLHKPKAHLLWSTKWRNCGVDKSRSKPSNDEHKSGELWKIRVSMICQPVWASSWLFCTLSIFISPESSLCITYPNL